MSKSDRNRRWRERHPERHAADTLANYYRHREEILARRTAVRDHEANRARVKAWAEKKKAEAEARRAARLAQLFPDPD